MSAYHTARLLDPPASNRVLVALANGPARFCELQERTSLASGTLGMTLARMAKNGTARNLGRGMWMLTQPPDYAGALAWTRGL